MTKKILITGRNSYVGNKLAEWLASKSEEYEVTKESVRNNKWKEIDFSKFDVVVHVAGIAHQDTKNDQEDLYYKVNTDLTINIAKKAKAEGVRQFIFMSSMIVYGTSSKVGEIKIITRETIPKPINFYGNSKLLAERGILPLQTENFNIVILRPPMIYGKDSKGNYPVLARVAKITPVFPEVKNQRSMLYIKNLTEFIRLLIDNNEKGIFFPQNKEYVNTSEMVKIIAEVYDKKIILNKYFNIPIKIAASKVKVINKVFGSFIYTKELSIYKTDYSLYNFEESIKETELGNNN